MIKPLWEPTNTTLKSSVFVVQPGQTAILTAVGFNKCVRRTDATEPVTTQRAVLHRLLFTYDISARSNTCECSGIVDMQKQGAKANVIADQVVRRCGCEWANLTQGCNLAMLSLPGTYQFEFNSDEMIGSAQIYLELVDSDKLPVRAHAELYF